MIPECGALKISLPDTVIPQPPQATPGRMVRLTRANSWIVFLC
eukprot:COSAG06_NODE_59913_length_272_cov_1.497110_2_plen_42_part_01